MGHLDHEPLVHHQPLVRPLLGKGRQFERAEIICQKRRERAHLLGHVARIGELPLRHGPAIAPGDQRQKRVGQRPLARLLGVRTIRRAHQVTVIQRHQVGRQHIGHLSAHHLAPVPDRLRIGGAAHVGKALRQVILGRQPHAQGAEGRIQRVVGDQLAQRIQVIRIRGRAIADHLHQGGFGQLAAGLPSVEGVGVMGQQKDLIGLGCLTLQDHRGRESAQGRGDGTRLQPVEGKGLFFLDQLQKGGRHDLLAGAVQQTDGKGDDLGFLVALAGRGGQHLFQRDRELIALPGLAHHDLGRAGLGIPALELRQIAARRILEHLQPILDRAGLAVVAVEVQIQRAGIGVIPDQPFQHPDDLGPFFIDRGGVEIVDLLKAFGPDGMRQRPAVFAELPPAQVQHVGNPLHRFRPHVGGELGVAEDGQPFFQAQLEPVAAGDAVAGPVVEILMRDDRLDPFEIGIRRGARIGQHGGGVEDVQPLVLHRAHVEIVDSHDVEDVEVIFPAIDLLVPDHRLLQRLKREIAFVLVARTDPDVQLDLVARPGGEIAGQVDQFPRDQRKQIGGLGPGVVPFGKAFARVALVAVGQKHRQVALDPHGEGGHHVGTVGVIGDLAKALRLALGRIHAVRHVKPLQRGVGGGRDFDLGLPGKGAFGDVAGQAVGGHLRGDILTVDPGPDQAQLLALKKETAVADGGIRHEAHPRHDARGLGRQAEGQVHIFDQPGRRGVILQIDRRICCVFHPCLRCGRACGVPAVLFQPGQGDARGGGGACRRGAVNFEPIGGFLRWSPRAT